MNWLQNYDPLGYPLLSTLIAALPIVLLLALLLFSRLKTFYSAYFALTTAFIIATWVYKMPFKMAAASLGFGIVYGLLPIGWIVINVFFLFGVLTRAGIIDGLRSALVHITDDKRFQLLIVAFCFGAGNGVLYKYIHKNFHAAVKGPAHFCFKGHNAVLLDGIIERYVVNGGGYNNAPAMSLRGNGRGNINPLHEFASE